MTFTMIFTGKFVLDFLSRIFLIHMTAGKRRGGGGYFFNFSLPLPPASQTLKTLARRLLPTAYLFHIASSRTWTQNSFLYWKFRTPLSQNQLRDLIGTPFIKSNLIKNEYPSFLIDQVIQKYPDYNLSRNQN